MNLFDLFVKIGVKDDASDKISKLSGKLGKGLQTAAKVGVTAVAAVGTAAAAMGAALAKGVADVAEYGDNIDKMSQKMGLSAEKYQEWDFIMQHSGTSMETLKASMKTLANAAESGSDAFEQLGITQQEIANMSQEELFEATLTALQNVTNETERTYLAGKLLGRGATELGPLLNTSAEDVEAMRQQVHDLGGVMSNESVKAAAAYQDSLQNLKTAVSGVGRELTTKFLPGAVKVMDGLSAIITGDDSGFALLKKGIEDVLSNLETSLPKFLDAGTEIVITLAEAVVNNLPKIMESTMKIIKKIVSTIIENLPEIVRSGLEIIVSLAQGLVEYLPEIIPAVVDVILEIVDILTEPDSVVKLVEAALQIMLAITKGLIEAIPKLIEAVPEIISNLVQAFKDSLPSIKEVGGEIVDAIKNGISAAWDSFVSWFNGIWDRLFGGGNVDVNVNANESGARGSHASGLSYVPYNGYIARLHEGERVLTAKENRAYEHGGSGVQIIQNIYSQAVTAADLMEEAQYNQEKAVLGLV